MSPARETEAVEFCQMSEISVGRILRKIQEDDIKNKRTHIVATMGPAIKDAETVAALIDNGVNVCRFNFSHGDHASQGKMLAMVREGIAKRPHANVGLMLDTKGPEIRTGFLKEHKPITLVHGQSLKITTDYTLEGDNECIACSYPKLTQSVKVGSRILIADGSLVCDVTEIHDDHVVVKVLNNATVGEKKNMNLPGVKVELPILSDKDINDIVNFGIPNNFDFIALSFAQSAEDIMECKRVLGEAGKHIKIIPKIENVEGIVNFDEILEVSDGVMIARGDLGMEIPLEKVCLAQKYMINKCNKAAKPVITATQMLESMITNPRPTRAEASDVVNAVLDGSDCVMLSGESANGKYPVECVNTMARVCFEAEDSIAHRKVFSEIIESSEKDVRTEESLARSVASLAMDLNAAAIISFSPDGYLTRYISKCKPACPVFSHSTEEHVVKYMSACRGVTGRRVPSFVNKEENIKNALEAAKEVHAAKKGDHVVVIYQDEKSIEETKDLIRVMRV